MTRPVERRGASAGRVDTGPTAPVAGRASPDLVVGRACRDHADPLRCCSLWRRPDNMHLGNGCCGISRMAEYALWIAPGMSVVPDWLLRMSISGHPTKTGPSAVLARVRSEVADLAGMLWASRCGAPAASGREDPGPVRGPVRRHRPGPHRPPPPDRHRPRRPGPQARGPAGTRRPRRPRRPLPGHHRRPGRRGAPGSGTPWSRPATTPPPPTSPRTPTAPPPDS